MNIDTTTGFGKRAQRRLEHHFDSDGDGHSPESMAREYCVPIEVVPTRLRGF